jgi:uncharacterized membrane protein YdbT with pleckstrin-like domain
MSYIDNNLLPGEQVIYRTYLHWIIFAKAVFWILIGLLVNYIITTYHFYFLYPYKTIILLVIFVIAIFYTLSAYITYVTSEYGVTNKRVIVKMGFIRRVTSENFLQQIENIQAQQSVLGRILGYGTIIIIGTGGTREPFDLIAKPLMFHRQVQIQVEQSYERREKS